MGVEVQRDQADKRQFDGLALKNRKPGRIYRWARKDDFQIALHRFRGYEVVDKTEDEVTSILNSGTRMKKAEDVDNTIQLGDLVLMSIDENLYNQRRKDEVQLALDREVATKRAFHASVRRITGQEGNSYEEKGEGRGYTTSYVDSPKGAVPESDYERIMAEVEGARGAT